VPPPNQLPTAATPSLISSIGTWAHANHRLKHQEQNHGQDHRPDHRMQHQGIEAIAEGYAIEPIAAHHSQYPAHFGLVVLDIRSAQRLPHRP